MQATLLILDWDNTVMPTWALEQIKQAQGADSIKSVRLSARQVGALARLEKAALEALALALQPQHKTDLLILSNGSKSWLKKSAATFMPTLDHWLRSKRVPRISCYQKEDLVNVGRWKRQGLDHVAGVLDMNVYQHLVSLGDRENDRATVQAFARDRQVQVSSILFWPNPSLCQLEAQWHYIKGKLPPQIHFDGWLNLNKDGRVAAGDAEGHQVPPGRADA